MPRAGMCLDTGIHHGLCIARFVAFVMPEPSESDEVEHDVKVELASVVKCDLNDTESCFRIVGIDMKYRCLRDMGSIGRIDRTAAKPR